MSGSSALRRAPRGMIFLGPEWNSMVHQEHILAAIPKTNYDQARPLSGMALSRLAFITNQLPEGGDFTDVIQALSAPIFGQN